jgi:hypothetical protein
MAGDHTARKTVNLAADVGDRDPGSARHQVDFGGFDRSGRNAEGLAVLLHETEANVHVLLSIISIGTATSTR